MPDPLEPQGAALYALVGMVLVAFGAILATSAMTLEQRGTAFASLVAVLGLVAWRARRAP